MMINKKRFSIVVAVLVTVLLTSLVLIQNVKPESQGDPPSTTTVFFLKVNGINGESKVPGHTNEIQLLSFNWMEAIATSDFNFTMQTNPASPIIALAVAKGTIYTTATLTVGSMTNGRETDLLKWDFKNVRFTSFDQNGTTSHGLPIETFSITFSWIQITYMSAALTALVKTFNVQVSKTDPTEEKSWQTQYTFFVENTEGGTTSFIGTQTYNMYDVMHHTYPANTVFEVMATPDEGWTFDHWELDGHNYSSANPLYFELGSNSELLAVFTKQWTLTVYSACGEPYPVVGEYIYGSPYPSVGSYTYNNGSQVTCNVTSPVTVADYSYSCAGWTGTGSVPASGTNTSVTFTITQNSTITWDWIFFSSSS